MGYDAITPGEDELLEGIDSLKVMLKRAPGIKVVSANIEDKSGKRVFPEYEIFDRGGLKVAVTGVTGGSYYNFNITRGVQKKDDFTFEDSKAALQRVVPELRKKADVVVVLLHESPADARRIVDELPGMDVVVVGHNPGYLFNPDRVGQTLVVRAGNRGQYLEVLELTLGDDDKIVDYNGEGKPMGDGVAKDPKLDQIVTKYETDWNQRKTTDQRKSAAKAALIQGTEKYVGAQMCARCHADVYTKWAQTPHAQAYQTLLADNQQLVADCVECHTTGYGEPTGYEFSVSTDKKGENPTVLEDPNLPDLRNVQCESCHGMGTFHGTSNLVKAPGVEVCQNCHTGEYAKNFDYAQAVAKVH